jgi:hypothetical protein
MQAGAGIVYDSVPELELAETEQKLAAMRRAAGIETPEAAETARTADAPGADTPDAAHSSPQEARS